MQDLQEGLRPILVTRTTTDDPDLFEDIPREFRETIREVHYADGSNPELLGQQGTYGIDVDEEWFNRIAGAGGFPRPSNLIDVVTVDPGRLGEGLEHTTSEEIGPLSELLEEMGVPELPPFDLDAALDGEAPSRYYMPGPVLDQGKEGACTGFAGANFVNGGPMMKRPYLNNADARLYYLRNKEIDEWPGEDYDGSSVSAMCKQLIELGRVKKAAVTTSFEEMLRWELAGMGGLMISTPWHEGMYRTDAKGFIRPTGRKVGGHAIWDRGRTGWRSAIWFNSWGLGFGSKGNGYVSEEDFRWLINNGLRAYAATQVA